MNTDQKREKASSFFDAMTADKNVMQSFVANPLLVLEQEGILTTEEATIPEMVNYYQRFAKDLEGSNPIADNQQLLGFFSFGCDGCKFEWSSIVIAAVVSATIATGEIDVPVLAAALGIEEEAVGAVVGGASSISLGLAEKLLSMICGC